MESMSSITQNPLVSVVTPVYNAVNYVAETYACLCRQTYDRWEWVVVDDGSTDGSASLLHDFAQKDERILYYTQPNSGNAKYARDRAISLAHGAWVMALDADDRISDDCLSQLVARQQATGASIVYPRMVFVDETSGQPTHSLPVAHFDTGRTYRGRDLVALTLPEWQIGCNGGLYSRPLLNRLSYPESKEPLWLNSDELDERCYLFDAPCVAFSEARYYYRVHDQSVTKAFSPKLFQTLKTHGQIVRFTLDNFGRKSREYAGAQRLAFNDFRGKLRLFLRHNRRLESAEDAVLASLAGLFALLDVDQLTPFERLRYLNLCHFKTVLLSRGLVVAPRYTLSLVFQRAFPRLYLHTLAPIEHRRRQRDQLASAYSGAPHTRDFTPCVVCVFNGYLSGGGLVDRLRGVVSTWEVCRRHGLDFRLSFTHPFPLTDYLLPADYDWRIPETQISHSSRQTHLVLGETLTDEPWDRRRLHRLLNRQLLRHRHLQRHVYTNAAFCYDADFAELFCQLFRPAPSLERLVDQTVAHIGGPFITVSARFGNLLGDFNEQNYGHRLSATEARRLLDSCREQTLRLWRTRPDLRVVVCSDSSTFVRLMQREACVYTIPGTITHIDNDTRQGYDHYLKTFLDFFVISRASSCYLLRGPGMLFSGFPYAASRLGRRPFEEIKF